MWLFHQFETLGKKSFGIVHLQINRIFLTTKMSVEDQFRIREFVAFQEKKVEEEKKAECQRLMKIQEHAETALRSLIMPLILKAFETGGESFLNYKIDFVDYKSYDYASFIMHLCSFAHGAGLRTCASRTSDGAHSTIQFSWHPKEVTEKEELQNFESRFEFAQTSDGTFSVPLGDLEESRALDFVKAKGYQAHVGFSHGIDQEKMVFISKN